MQKNLHTIQQYRRLRYFWEAPIGGSPERIHKNLDLSTRYAKDTDPALFRGGGNLPWRLSQRLEGRDPDISNAGVWSITQWRNQRRFGNVANHLVPYAMSIRDVPQETWHLARKARLFAYLRVPYAADAIKLLQKTHEVRLSLEITSDWYDPPGGIIPPLSSESMFIGSHAVPLAKYSGQRFVFLNSWGADWGTNGLGAFPREYWEKSIIDAWYMCSDGLFVPALESAGVVARGWKWEPEVGFAVHGREIYDATNDEYLAWTFCVVRDGYLDIDEFFVWPSERGKGYARQLACMVLQLSKEMQRPIRPIVSFADTESDEFGGASAVARLLNVRLVESDARWASMIGTANALDRPSRNWRPSRPASILEAIRPNAEPPLKKPQQYEVFFGTNRNPVNLRNTNEGFTNQRGSQLNVGRCLVEIAVTHTFGAKGRWFGSLWPPATSNSTSLKLIQCLAREQFKRDAASFQTIHGDRAQNLLFVHGYNNSFKDAVLRAAQLGVDLKIPGSTFVFSWPSAADLKQYSVDEATIESSIMYLEEFVVMILRDFPDVPLNIVAHSMGNRGVMRVLERLVVHTDLPGRLGQVVFAAPDVDADLFRQSTPKYKNMPKRMSAYVSRADLAIQTSRWLHGYDRVGLAPPVTIAEGVETVLVEGFDVFEFFCHDYVATAAPVLHDLFNLIHYDSHPDNRPGIRPAEQEDGKIFWVLPMK